MSARAASGKPLRFFALLLTCWILGRVALSNQRDAAADGAGKTAGVASAPFRRAPARQWFRPVVDDAITSVVPARMKRPATGPTAPIRKDAQNVSADAFSGPTPPIDAYTSDTRHFGAMPFSTPPPIPPPSPPGYAARRWRGTAWLLWRPGNGNPAAVAAAGQLGASQAGIRLDIEPAPRALPRLSAYARFTRALVHPAQPEAALGMSIQPGRDLPVTLAVERRIDLGEGGRDAMALVVAGGFGPSRVLPGVLGEGYAQAGVVGMKNGDRFVDGRFSLLRPLAGTPFLAGVTLSGGAQPHVHRLDIGPTVQVRLSGPLPARLMLEWRERVAGHAYPRSGMALTLASDF